MQQDNAGVRMRLKSENIRQFAYGTRRYHSTASCSTTIYQIINETGNCLTEPKPSDNCRSAKIRSTNASWKWPRAIGWRQKTRVFTRHGNGNGQLLDNKRPGNLCVLEIKTDNCWTTKYLCINTLLKWKRTFAGRHHTRQFISYRNGNGKLRSCWTLE